MEDSGEIVFQNHTHHSQKESVDHGSSSSIASQLGRESVTHQSANTNVGNSCNNDISDHLMGIRDMIKQQLVDIHMLNGKMVSINGKVDSKIADLRNEMHDMRESHSVSRENEAIREDHPLIIHNSPPILEYEGNPRKNHMQPIGSPDFPTDIEMVLITMIFKWEILGTDICQIHIAVHIPIGTKIGDFHP